MVSEINYFDRFRGDHFKIDLFLCRFVKSNVAVMGFWPMSVDALFDSTCEVDTYHPSYSARHFAHKSCSSYATPEFDLTGGQTPGQIN
jgi:hypothetical protein